MRTFDAIGLLVVAAWFAAASFYVYRHEFDRQSARPADSETVALEEGDTWLLLRRDGRDVGYLHRTHTRLEAGWLAEYDMLLVVKVLDATLPLGVEVKAELDRRARLRGFDATIRAAGRRLDAQGDVRDRRLSLVLQTGGEPRRRTIALDSTPRLAVHSVQTVVAREDLEPGDTFAHTFFDATSMGTRTIEMVYQGREAIDVLGESRRAWHVRQRVAGTELDVYLDAEGRVLVQEFPFEIIGTRVDPELGRARSATLRKRAREARRKLDRESSNSAIGRALQLLDWGGHFSIDDSDGETDTGGDAR